MHYALVSRKLLTSINTKIKCVLYFECLLYARYNCCETDEIFLASCIISWLDTKDTLLNIIMEYWVLASVFKEFLSGELYTILFILLWEKKKMQQRWTSDFVLLFTVWYYLVWWNELDFHLTAPVDEKKFTW